MTEINLNDDHQPERQQPTVTSPGKSSKSKKSDKKSDKKKKSQENQQSTPTPVPSVKSLNTDVNEIMGIMKDNLQKAVEREGFIEDLEKRASNLELATRQFEIQASEHQKDQEKKSKEPSMIENIKGITLFIFFVTLFFIVFFG